MSNRLKAANDALWALVKVTFNLTDDWRNVGGHKQPKGATDAVSGLIPYHAQDDDSDAEVLGVLCGPIYDLQITPTLIFAFSGKTKADRQAAAWARVEIFKVALAADPTLGGVVDYAMLGNVREIDADDANWMAGGLELTPEILFQAPSRAG